MTLSELFGEESHDQEEREILQLVLRLAAQKRAGIVKDTKKDSK